MLTLDQIGDRVGKLETELAELRAALDLEQAVKGVQRGLASKAAGKSRDAREALLKLRRELFPDDKTVPSWAIKAKRPQKTRRPTKRR